MEIHLNSSVSSHQKQLELISRPSIPSKNHLSSLKSEENSKSAAKDCCVGFFNCLNEFFTAIAKCFIAVFDLFATLCYGKGDGKRDSKISNDIDDLSDDDNVSSSKEEENTEETSSSHLEQQVIHDISSLTSLKTDPSVLLNLCKYENEGANPFQNLHKKNSNPFKFIVTHAHIVEAFQQGAALGEIKPDRKTFLHYARSQQTAELLLKMKPELLQVKDEFGRTALHYATHNAELTKFLVTKGSDVTTKDTNKMTAFDLLMINSLEYWWIDREQCINAAIYLVKSGTEINKSVSGSPLIIHAIDRRSADLMQVMISTDPTIIHAKTNDGQTAVEYTIHLAKDSRIRDNKEEYLKIAEALIEKGADASRCLKIIIEKIVSDPQWESLLNLLSTKNQIL